MCTVEEQETMARIEEDMGLNGTEEKYPLSREDTHEREGQVRRAAQRLWKNKCKVWPILSYSVAEEPKMVDEKSNYMVFRNSAGTC